MSLVASGTAQAQFAGPITWLLARNASEARPTRIAILNFGPPAESEGAVDDTLGLTIDPESWRAVIPLLEQDRTDVVVVRMNSGGGRAWAVEKFGEVFASDFKPRFRTIAWIHAAVGNAALCALPLDEWAMTPKGNIGWASCIWYADDRFPCTQMLPSQSLELRLAQAAAAAEAGHRSPALAHAMLIQSPLSEDFDSNGKPVLRPDEDGSLLLNRKGAIMNLDAQTAQKARLSMGTAATREQLADVIGCCEVEWVGEKAAAAIDGSMHELDVASKLARQLLTKYMTTSRVAEQTATQAGRSDRIAESKRHLARLKTILDTHPGFLTALGLCPEWTDEQSAFLEKLEATPTK